MNARKIITSIVVILIIVTTLFLKADKKDTTAIAEVNSSSIPTLLDLSAAG